MTALPENLLSLSDDAWNRLRARLGGLSDDEYLWEPVPGCWTIRPGEDGSPVADGSPLPPEPAPFTTIAWRLAHVIDLLQAERTATWFGQEPAPQDGQAVVPGSASEALPALEHAYDVWRRRLASVNADDLTRPLGAVAGPYAEHDGTAFALHILDEFIHHGAEVGVLRDLYLWQRPRDPFVLACLRGDRAAVEAALARDPALLDRVRAGHPGLLTEAAAAQQPEAVRLLADLGFSVDVPSGSGRRPAHYAAGSGDVDTLRLLVARGADLTATDPQFGATPLGWAQWFGQSGAADYLASV
ncbi:MAG: hypothetical protein HOW71_00015 [Nonomuraea sp.]|nr:hypothetical protein [Nonomuraea sp.]